MGIPNQLLTSSGSSVTLSFTMNKIILHFLCILGLFSAPCTASALDGPLQIKNQFPLFIYANAPHLESAVIEDAFSAGISHSSINLIRESAEWSVGLDMEITELDLRFKKSIKDFIEIGVELPILSFNSGFLDGFLDSYHNAFGFSDYGRSQRPVNQFLYKITRKDTLIIRGKNGRTEIGDIRMTLKAPLLRGDPAASLQGSLELPSGDAGKGYGNGSVDAGLAVFIDKNIGKNFRSYLNFGFISPGKLTSHEKINLKEYFYGGAAIEAAFWKNISLLGQLFVQGSPFPKTDIPSLDRTAVLLSVGGRYYAGRNSVELSLTEDPNTAGAPDFTLNVSLKKKF
jgi:hypothetical protein